MASQELLNLIITVLKSWEVIAVTVAIVLYLFLVFYVARLNRRTKKASSFFKPKGAAASKKKKGAGPVEVEVTDDE